MTQPMRRAATVALLIIVTLAAVGCATQRRADRAYQQGRYQVALEHYKELIERGTEDWEVYYRAAKAANHGANFSLAERYFSRAMRYGGGTKVAREFASFYLKTSNYGKAARLLQYLLEQDINKQSVYNNLGTALMYGGAPLDAESYLLIAQQMDPSDPLPYINLGVLYERHFYKPKLALGFYTCYAKMTGGSGPQAEKVRSRIAQLHQEVGGDAGQVPCGEAYHPGAAAKQRRGRAEGGAQGRGEGRDGTAESSGKTIDLDFDGSGKARDPKQSGQEVVEELEQMEDADKSDGEARSESEDGESGEDPQRDVVIERQVEEGSRGGARNSVDDSEGRARDDGAGRGRAESDEMRLERARKAYENGKHKLVVDIVSGLSLNRLDATTMKMYGASLAELGRNEEAAQWLEWAVKRKPEPGSIGRLLEVYRRLDRRDDLRALCKRLRDRDGLDDALEDCPSPAESLSDAEKKKALEKYRQQQ